MTPGTPFARQYEEIVGATRNPMRQVFFEPGALISWFGDTLTAAEQERLRTILG